MLDSLSCYPVIPYISAGGLQSVHKLGSGIARLQNRSMFIIESSPGDNVSRIIGDYAQRAVDLASSNSIMPAVEGRRRRDGGDDMDLIVGNIVIREWETFFRRVVSAG